MRSSDKKIQEIIGSFPKEDLRYLDRASVFSEPRYRCVRDEGFIEVQAFHNELYINIGVVPSSRHKGIGKLLVAGLLTWFVHSRYKALHWNVHKDNLASIRLAIGAGFQEYFPGEPIKHYRYFALGKAPHSQYRGDWRC